MAINKKRALWRVFTYNYNNRVVYMFRKSLRSINDFLKYLGRNSFRY